MSEPNEIDSGPKAFYREDMYITDNSPGLPYEDWKGYAAVHHGQAKLLFSEVFFFIMFIDYKKVPKPNVVMIGAAPGHHYPA